MAKILVNYPSRSRPHKFFKIIQDYHTKSSGKHDIHYLIKIDANDYSMNPDRVSAFCRKVGIEFTLLVLPDCKGKIDAINRGVSLENRDFVVCIADDMDVEEFGWDDILVQDFGGDYSLSLNYNTDPRLQDFTSLLVLPIIGKDLYNRFGYIYHPAYVSEFCDNEQTEVFEQLQKNKHIDRKVFHHDWDNNQDALMQRNIRIGHGVDKVTYDGRKTAGDRTGMKKIISYSIFGNHPKYIAGLKKNCELAQSLFPDWTVQIYWASNAFADELENVSKFKNVNIEIQTVQKELVQDRVSPGAGMYWRFLPIFNQHNQVVIIRDVDSRLSVRDKRCVDEWIKSPFKFSVIKDHPCHLHPFAPIMGGMWGVKGWIDSKYEPIMREFAKNGVYQSDQAFLREIIWPLCKNNCMVHSLDRDGWFSRERDPEDYNFIGQSFSENERPDVHPMR